MTSQGHRTHGRNATDLDGDYTSGINPFGNDKSDIGFNPEFPQLGGGRGIKTHKDEARQPMLAGVDMDVQRPSAVGHRAKTVGAFAPASASKASKNFFGFKATINDTMGGYNPTESSYQEEKKVASNVADRNTPIVIGRRKIAVWPYDDYHLVQKMYYEKLQENSLDSLSHHQFPHSSQQRKQQAAKEAEKAAAAAAAARQRDQSLPIFSRPADPVDIPTAVKGLSLNQFEERSEERAINIISTWLFDAELIDELLVNGGMSATMMANTADKYRDKQDCSSMDESERSVKTSEGVEIGSHGYPIEGSNKMDKEISKLRNATKRQLALINARLNDGVVATGGEVQELVNAVIATKDDIGRLRELSTYVSNNQDVVKTSNFMLTRYPKLKQAINARRNIARVFRELEFFAMIPGTCDRLREELHAGEWTAHEWNSLRTVTREHCDLEIFLVEAELEMKKRLQEEEQEQQLNQMMNLAVEPLSRGDRSRFTKQSMRSFGTTAKQSSFVDRFLDEHVRNVWELGEEIRIRIMSGISSAFELAMNNPAGMVALVEAVERYEFANEEYMAVYGAKAGTQKDAKLRFTDMRAAALAELYKDLESRCFEVFQELTANAADVMSGDDDDDVINKQFSAIIRAAHELSGEIIIVKDRMAPCFPPNWHVASLWTTCVAHVCCNNILQQIGGPEGQRLHDLSVTQMLDLVAWVENFREILLEIFPDLDKIAAPKQIYLNKPPRLVSENSRTIDLKLAEDSLVWVNTTLWSVHDLAKDEFLFRTKEQTEEWLNNVYRDEHNKAQTSEGRLVTSLCEDVFSLAAVQVRTIRERLTRRSEALVQAVGVVLKHLFEKQTTCRELFCTDFETCCAAANDFLRMSEKCEEIVNEIKNECKLSDTATEILDEQTAALLTLYSEDAVYAAKKTHVYCFHPIEEAIANELFSPEWEQELTRNELALTLVRTLDDFMEDLETFLDELMVTRAVEAQISSSVNFYIRCLLKKSSTHTGKKPVFNNFDLAVRRMRGDSQVMREYFDGLAESMPTLGKIVESEFSLLECIFELISIAAGNSKSDAQDFILILQKRVKNIYITKLVVGDLWHLVNPAEERDIYEIIDGMEDTLNAVAPIDEKAIAAAHDRSTVPGLRMDEMMARHAEIDKRRRPMKIEAIEKAQVALKSWGWGKKKDGEEGKMTAALAAATAQAAAAATHVAAAATAVRSSVIARPTSVQTGYVNASASSTSPDYGSGSSKPTTPSSGYSPNPSPKAMPKNPSSKAMPNNPSSKTMPNNPSPKTMPKHPRDGKTQKAKPRPKPSPVYDYDGPAEF